MKIIMESTSIFRYVNGEKYRVWSGVTESGTPCKVYVGFVMFNGVIDDPGFKDLEEVDDLDHGTISSNP